MASKEITRDEVLQLRASAQVLLEQAEKMLAKMDDKLIEKKKTNVTDLDIARIHARRMKNFYK